MKPSDVLRRAKKAYTKNREYPPASDRLTVQDKQNALKSVIGSTQESPYFLSMPYKILMDTDWDFDRAIALAEQEEAG